MSSRPRKRLRNSATLAVAGDCWWTSGCDRRRAARSRSGSCALGAAALRACRSASFSVRSRWISDRAARSRSLCSSEAILLSDTDLCWRCPPHSCRSFYRSAMPLAGHPSSGSRGVFSSAALDNGIPPPTGVAVPLIGQISLSGSYIRIRPGSTIQRPPRSSRCFKVGSAARSVASISGRTRTRWAGRSLFRRESERIREIQIQRDQDALRGNTGLVDRLVLLPR